MVTTGNADPNARERAEKLTEGERASFDAEAIPHLDLLYRYALRLSGDEMYADDLVQETMLKAYRAWGRFRKGTNVRAWLLTILRNAFVSDYRKLRRQGATVDLDELEPYIDSGHYQEGDPAKQFLHRWVEHEVEAAVQRVPEVFRDAFLLSVEGLDYREIGEVIGVPLGTVKSRVSRARRFLRGELTSYAVREGHVRPTPPPLPDASVVLNPAAA